MSNLLRFKPTRLVVHEDPVITLWLTFHEFHPGIFHRSPEEGKPEELL
jgi:hypothetical protein